MSQQAQWFISPARTKITEEGVLRYFPAMQESGYPYLQWSCVTTNDRQTFLVRWVAEEPIEVLTEHGRELVSEQDWLLMYSQYPEFFGRWADQPCIGAL